MCSLTMKHTRVVSTKCTPGFACRAFSDTTLVCFIVNEHTTKCSHYITGKMILYMAHILWSSTIYQTGWCIEQSWLCKWQLHLLEILSVNLSKHVLSFAKSTLYALLCYARRSAGTVMSQFSSQVYIYMTYIYFHISKEHETLSYIIYPIQYS